MKQHSPILRLSLVFLLLSSLIVLTVPSTPVQAVFKPSIPQFSLKLIDNSYYVPSSTITDSYTGAITTKPGYRAYNRSMEFTIKNQPFKSYTDADGYNIDLYYRVAFKGHFGDDTEWRTFGLSGEGMPTYKQSNSGYTVVLINIEYPIYPFTTKYPDGSQLDFKVEAFTGHFYGPDMGDIMIGIRNSYLVCDEASGWSDIQTFTMISGSSSSLPSQTTTLSPPSVTFEGNNTQPSGQMSPLDFVFTKQVFLFVVSVLFVGVIVTVVLIFLKKHLKPPIYTNSFPP